MPPPAQPISLVRIPAAHGSSGTTPQQVPWITWTVQQQRNQPRCFHLAMKQDEITWSEDPIVLSKNPDLGFYNAGWVLLGGSAGTLPGQILKDRPWGCRGVQGTTRCPGGRGLLSHRGQQVSKELRGFWNCWEPLPTLRKPGAERDRSRCSGEGGGGYGHANSSTQGPRQPISSNTELL